jgi:hypothetical protein
LAAGSVQLNNAMADGRLMERYQTGNADFYGAYQVARIIVDAGGGSATPPTPPATPHP